MLQRLKQTNSYLTRQAVLLGSAIAVWWPPLPSYLFPDLVGRFKTESVNIKDSCSCFCGVSNVTLSDDQGVLRQGATRQVNQAINITI